MEKVNKRIKELKYKFKFSKVKQALKDAKVISYSNILQDQYVMCPIDKGANNISFICKKYYIKRIRFIKYNIKHFSTSEWLKNNDEEYVFIDCQKCIKHHMVQYL